MDVTAPTCHHAHHTHRDKKTMHTLHKFAIIALALYPAACADASGESSPTGTKGEPGEVAQKEKAPVAMEPCRAVWSGKYIDGNVETFEYDDQGRVRESRHSKREPILYLWFDDSYSRFGLRPGETIDPNDEIDDVLEFHLKSRTSSAYKKYGPFYLNESHVSKGEYKGEEIVTGTIVEWSLGRDGTPISSSAHVMSNGSPLGTQECVFEHSDPKARIIPGLSWGEHGQTKAMCGEGGSLVTEIKYAGPAHGISQVTERYPGSSGSTLNFVYEGCPVRGAK